MVYILYYHIICKWDGIQVLIVKINDINIYSFKDIKPELN